MTVEELEKQLKSFQSDFELTKKDFQVKLDAAKKDASEWKTIAEQKEAEAKKFQEDAEKTRKEKEKSESEAREREIVSFVELAKKEESITPAEADLILPVMKSMTSSAEVAKFEKSEGKTVSYTALSALKEFVSGLPKRKITGESTTGGKQHAAIPGAKKEGDQHFVEVFSNGKRMKMPVEGADLAAKASEYQAEQRTKFNREISYGDALIEVEKEMAAA